MIGFIAQEVCVVIQEALKLGAGVMPNGNTIDDIHYLDKIISIH